MAASPPHSGVCRPGSAGDGRLLVVPARAGHQGTPMLVCDGEMGTTGVPSSHAPVWVWGAPLSTSKLQNAHCLRPSGNQPLLWLCWGLWVLLQWDHTLTTSGGGL